MTNCQYWIIWKMINVFAVSPSPIQTEKLHFSQASQLNNFYALAPNTSSVLVYEWLWRLTKIEVFAENPRNAVLSFSICWDGTRDRERGRERERAQSEIMSQYVQSCSDDLSRQMKINDSSLFRPLCVRVFVCVFIDCSFKGTARVRCPQMLSR